MTRTCVLLLLGLFLVAAGDPLPLVEKDGLKFWPAAPEDVRTAIKLPVWKLKVEWQEEEKLVEVLVAADGATWVNGTRLDAKELTARLTVWAETRRITARPFQQSMVPILVRASKDAGWGPVRQALRSAVHPDVRMWKVYFAMVTSEGEPVAVPVILPEARGLKRTPSIVRPTLRFQLDVPRGADKTRILIDGSETGRGYMGFALAEGRLVKRFAEKPKLHAVIDGQEKVPYGDVMKALHLVRKVGIERVEFAVGSPTGARTLDEPDEIPIAGYDEIARLRKCLRLVKRGKIRVWPAAKPEVRKAVKLPNWPLDAPGLAPKEQELVEVLVTKDGTLRIGGNLVDLKKLTMEFLVCAEVRRDENHPMQPSLTPVVFHASKDVRWREMQWAMQAAADPDVRMFRLYFATRTKDGTFAYVPVFLPTDHRLRHSGQEEAPLVTVELKRKREEKVTRVRLLDSELGSGDAAFATLAKRLKQIADSLPDGLRGELNAWAWTPHEDAVKVIAAFRAAGIEEFQFVGAPPPGKGK